MRVQFSGEPGIDAGGLEREWFELVTKELFAPKNGFFLCSAGDSEIGGSYHINPTSSLFNLRHLEYFRFAGDLIDGELICVLIVLVLGRLFGKAIMEQQVIPATLSLPLRKQILTTPVTFSDLEFVDPDLYRNLLYLENDDIDAEQLDLDFTVCYSNQGKSITCELMADGANIPVTNQNKEMYLQLRLRHRLFDSIKLQLEALLKGFYDIIPPQILSVFDYQELDMLLCGLPEIDLVDWRGHTEYMGEYNRLGNSL